MPTAWYHSNRRHVVWGFKCGPWHAVVRDHYFRCRRLGMSAEVARDSVLTILLAGAGGNYETRAPRA